MRTPPLKPPTRKQLAYLRDLAISRGQTFTTPRTSREASTEIRRLKALRPTGRVERRVEREDGERHISRERLDSAAVRRDEVTGYGSSATWSKVR